MFLYNGSQLDYKSQSTIGNKFRNCIFFCLWLGGSFEFWFIRFVDGKNEFSLEIDQRRKIKYMMETYVNKICVPKENIGKKIIFLYNGKDLSTKQNYSIKRVLCNKATIPVNNIIWW